MILNILIDLYTSICSVTLKFYVKPGQHQFMIETNKHSRIYRWDTGLIGGVGRFGNYGVTSEYNDRHRTLSGHALLENTYQIFIRAHINCN